MKKRLISIVLLVAMLSSLSIFASAETVMLDRSLPSFDEETAYKETDVFDGWGVRSSYIQGNGALSLYDDNGNKMIKMAITDSVSSGYNYAMLTMFVNRNIKEYYKYGMIISYDVIAPENGKIVFHTYGNNYPSRRLYSVDNLTLIPASASNTDVTDTTKQATLEKGKLHNIKLVLDTSSRSYTIFLDGIKVGDTYTFQDNYFASTNYWDKTTGEMKEIPPMYLSLRTNDSTTSYPLEAFVDNLKITSYNEEAIEVSSTFDIYDENGEIVSEYNPSLASHNIGMDIFNNDTETKEIAALSIKYKKNENGFNLLDSYSIKKLTLEKGYNRETLANMLIPDNDPAYYTKLMFLNNVYSPVIQAPTYSLTNDGTFVTVTKTDKPADVLVDKGTIEVSNFDEEITVSGIAQDAAGEPLLNVPVGLTILNKDVTKDAFISEYDALNAETSSISSFIHTDITTTDVKGNYSFKIEMPDSALMGDYLLIANVGGKEFLTTLRYLTTAQKQTSVKKINESLSKTASDFQTAVNENEFPLSLFLDYTSTKDMYNQVKDKSTFFELVKSYGEYSEELSETGNSINQFNVNLDNAILLSNLEGIDDIALLKQYAESIAEETGFLIGGITTANNDAVYTTLAAFTDFSSLDKINKCIAEAIVLYNVPNAENWGAIKSTIETYSTLLGVDLSDSTVDYDEVYHKMYDLKGSYTDISKIVTSFNELKTSTPIVITPPPVIAPPVIIPSVGGGGVASRPIVDEEIKKEEEKTEDTVIPENPKRVMNFGDVTEDFWGYEYIKSAYEKGLVNGISDSNFNPEGKLTREEFAAMLVRCASLSKKDSDISFSDVSDNDWFSSDVKTAYSYGIIKGREDGSFGAGEYITRQDIAVMINNMADNGLIPELKGETSEFADTDKVSDYALSSVSKVSAAKIFSGYEDLTFRPQSNATRAEAATLILRIYSLINN